MTIQVINTGTSANAGNGDSIRTAFTKVNQNFEELSTLVGTTGTTLTELVGDATIELFDHPSHIGITALYNDTENRIELELLPPSGILIGGVKSGIGLSVDITGTLDLEPATDAVLGGVKIGTGLSVDITGLITSDLTKSVLPLGTSSNIAIFVDENSIAELQGITYDADNLIFKIGDESHNIRLQHYVGDYFTNPIIMWQAHNASQSGNYTYYRTRGTQTNPLDIQEGDVIADIRFTTRLNDTDYSAAFITASVVSTATTQPIGNFTFSLNNGNFPTDVAELTSSSTWKINRLEPHLGAEITIDSNVVPFKDAISNLGKAGATWKNLYLEHGILAVSTSGNLSVNGTEISFTTSTLVNGIHTAQMSSTGTFAVSGDLTVIGEIVASKLTIEYTTVTTTLITTDDIIQTTNTTNATSTETGALIIGGGVGIAGDVFVGGKIEVSGVTVNDTSVNNWNTAYGWGDHSTASYLTSYTETDPIFSTSTAASITATNITNWDTAYGWGDHSTASYLTIYTETDPIFSTSTAASITGTDVTNWDIAYGWGDHSTASYLTSYTETDPIFSTSTAASITATNITNWDTAFGWGDHSTAGYLQSGVESSATSIIGVLKVIQTDEKFVSTTTNASLVEYDCSTAHIFNVTSMTGNFTSNLTNLSVGNEYATNVTLILNQGPIAYLSTGLQINGVSQSIYWQGGSLPTGTLNKKDIVNFSILTTGTFQYLVLGQLSSFG